MHHHHTQKEKQKAVELYVSSGFSPTTVQRTFGYPSRTLLSQWIDEFAPGERKATKPPKKFTDEERIETLLESARASTIKQVVEGCDIDMVTFYNWRKRFLGQEAQSVIDDINQDELLGEIDSLKEKVAELEAQAKFHKMEVTIWKGAAELVKERPRHRSGEPHQQGKDDSD